MTVSTATPASIAINAFMFREAAIAEELTVELSRLIGIDHARGDRKTRRVIEGEIVSALRRIHVRLEAADIWADRFKHRSDCATHNAPALPNGVCDCRSAFRQDPDDYRDLACFRKDGAQ